MQFIKENTKDYKNNLRFKFKKIRKELSYETKKNLDSIILNKIISLEEFKNCDTILTYVSTKIEVDTINLIKISLDQGKKVAVPKCINGTRLMEFYLINSLDDLEIANFSVLEPKANICEKLIDFENSICIVPGLAFDLNGYRIGYGKGYYDRFLAKYSKITIGICYSECILNKIEYGKYDKAVDILITNDYIKKINKEDENE